MAGIERMAALAVCETLSLAERGLVPTAVKTVGSALTKLIAKDALVLGQRLGRSATHCQVLSQLSRSGGKVVPSANVMTEASANALTRKLHTAILGSADGSFFKADGFVKTEAFYADLAGNADRAAHVKGFVKQWTAAAANGSSDQLTSFHRVFIKGELPVSTIDHELVTLKATRALRWERLSAKMNVPVPEAFHLHRGVRGDYAVGEVVAAWKNEAAHEMKVPVHGLSSWSTNRSAAAYFAEGTENAVIYEGKVPFRQTISDKWVDGDLLMSLYGPQDEVVVAATKGAIALSKSASTVRFLGKEYTFADRKALIQAWDAYKAPTIKP